MLAACGSCTIHVTCLWLVALIMALKIDVCEVAVALDSVEEAVRAVHDRLTIDDMLALCTNAAAGLTGRSIRYPQPFTLFD